MSGWRKCDTCRKVLPGTSFQGEATTCDPCLTTPAAVVVRKRTAPVVTTRAARPAPVPTAEPGPRKPLLGTVGSGDLEVRERRARRTATDGLTEAHPDEFARLLHAARTAEGLRPLGVVPPPAAAADEP